MPDVLVPFENMSSIVNEILNPTETQEAQRAQLGKKRTVILLEHALSFTERQFNEKIPGEKSYGERMGDWQVLRV
jgi:hypothetical protein